MSDGLSLADHITLELRADIIGGRLLPGKALIEADLVLAYNAALSTYLDDSEQQLLACH